MNTTLKGIMIVVIAILILAGFYFALPYLFKPVQTGTVKTIGDVPTPATKDASIKMIGAYWGEVDNPSNESLMCSNETMNAELSYVVEANTAIPAPNYESCYIKNNGKKTSTTVTEMHDYFVALTAIAETDRNNDVKACCIFEGTEYCGEENSLYLCTLG